MKNDYTFHNGHKYEYQNTDLRYGQLDDNVGIYESYLELKKVNTKFLEAIQHFGTGLVWYNPKCER
jgi:hypothetical protein